VNGQNKMSEPTTLADALEQVINQLEQNQNKSYQLGYTNASRRAIELIEDAIVTTCNCKTCHKLETLADELKKQAANL
jgi:hypothetical protein